MALAPTEQRRETEDLSDVYAFHDLDNSTFSVGPFTITSQRVAHSVPTYGFRVTCDNNVLTYTADTGRCPQLDELAAGATVLLSEASSLHSEHSSTEHLSAQQAGELAEHHHVQQLVVTHVPPWVNPDAVLAEATAAYSGPAVLAQRGQQHTLPVPRHAGQHI